MAFDTCQLTHELRSGAEPKAQPPRQPRLARGFEGFGPAVVHLAEELLAADGTRGPRGGAERAHKFVVSHLPGKVVSDMP